MAAERPRAEAALTSDTAATAATKGPPFVLPAGGLVYSEASPRAPVLCKPKIMPVRAPTLQQQIDAARMVRAPYTPSQYF